MKHSGFKIYLLIWLGTFISEIGTGMTSFALGIYTYQLTGHMAQEREGGISQLIDGQVEHL